MTATQILVAIGVLLVAGAIYVFAVTDDPPPRQNQGNDDEPQCDGELCVHADWNEDDA